MASLKAIRKRIVSVRNTQQITKAMKMAVVAARPYGEKLGEVVAGLASESSVREHALVRPRNPQGRVLLLVLTSDRGLCGGFNTNLIRRSEKFLKTPERVTALGLIGRKGYDFYKRRSVEIVEHVTAVTGSPIEIARDIVRRAVARFMAEECDAVYLLFTRFRSAISQVPVVEQLLPIETPETNNEPREYLFEPSRDALVEDLLPRYVEVKVFQAVLESLASEHGARMTAMESASKNASEMIERLTLEMNRARQATITKELMEIVGGAEALKG